MTDQGRPGADDAQPGESDTELDSSEDTALADEPEADETATADDTADDTLSLIHI